MWQLLMFYRNCKNYSIRLQSDSFTRGDFLQLGSALFVQDFIFVSFGCHLVPFGSHLGRPSNPSQQIQRGKNGPHNESGGKHNSARTDIDMDAVI